MKQRFHIDSTWKGHHNEDIHFAGFIELDHVVIANVDDDWRDTFYPEIKTNQEVAEHIAYNMIVNDLRLSQIDGFANLKDDMAVIL